MPKVQVEFTYRRVTANRQRRYQLTPKHHGFPVKPSDAQWHKDLQHDDEFDVFDRADQHDTCDEAHNLYGIAPDVENKCLLMLGSENQQVALFPFARDREPWHGYPLYPINGEDGRPPKAVFQCLQAAGLITERQRRRLMQGKEA
jgi:hypothetical protein